MGMILTTKTIPGSPDPPSRTSSPKSWSPSYPNPPWHRHARPGPSPSTLLSRIVEGCDFFCFITWQEKLRFEPDHFAVISLNFRALIFILYFRGGLCIVCGVNVLCEMGRYYMWTTNSYGPIPVHLPVHMDIQLHRLLGRPKLRTKRHSILWEFCEKSDGRNLDSWLRW